MNRIVRLLKEFEPGGNDSKSYFVQLPLRPNHFNAVLRICSDEMSFGTRLIYMPRSEVLYQSDCHPKTSLDIAVSLWPVPRFADLITVIRVEDSPSFKLPAALVSGVEWANACFPYALRWPESIVPAMVRWMHDEPAVFDQLARTRSPEEEKIVAKFSRRHSIHRVVDICNWANGPGGPGMKKGTAQKLLAEWQGNDPSQKAPPAIKKAFQRAMADIDRRKKRGHFSPFVPIKSSDRRS